jgi:CubicO group peptidase (beta-lactamase class C family)
MKLNLKTFFKLAIFTLLTAAVSYSMFTSIDTEHERAKEKESSEAIEVKPKPKIPDYKILFSPEIKHLQQTIQKKAKRYNISGSVLVGYKDQILYNEDFGYKNPITKTPIESELSYQLASVSKQYTAASILKLQEDKRLDIDTSVSKYLPGFKFEDVTVRDLLKHRSGLWNYMYLTENYWDNEIAPNNLEVVELLNTYAPRLNFPSGKYFSYSNTGYVVLGAIVEQVSNKSLGQYIKDEFLIPLCLDETFVEKTPNNEEFILDGYQPYRRGFIKLPAGFHNGAIGDKGIYASTKDLFNWFTHLKNEDILNKESVDLMFGRDAGGQNKRYGMGFRLDKDGKDRVIYHNGLWDGFRNGLEYHPKQDLVVIVMTHTQNKRKRYFQKSLVNAAKALIFSAKQRIDLKKQKDENEEELLM